MSRKLQLNLNLAIAYFLRIFCGRKPDALIMPILMKGHSSRVLKACAFLCLFEILLYFDGNYFMNLRVESLMTWENPTAFYCEIKVVIVVKKICNVFFFTPENLV